MCLIVVAVRLRADVPLMLAANRDEFFARPTQQAHFWPDAPQLLAGRDGEQGGTWLGITRSGRIAAVTNYRDGTGRRASGRSRGWLVRDYLMSEEPPQRYLEDVHADREHYDGFNLLVGSQHGLLHYSNRNGKITGLGAGVHGLSNHLLNTPWPKVEQAKSRLQSLAAVPEEALNEALFALLSDDAPAAEHTLPATGVSLAWERLLSSAFIRSPEYGTRSSTVILVAGSGQARFEERSFAAHAAQTTSRVEVLDLPKPAQEP
jgi:uncharacterized protein with NRDE domain